MGFKNVLGAIGKTAFPFIAAAATAGGPLGVMAAGAVGKALGIDKVDATPDGIASALASAQSKDPEALFKLQQAEQEFQVTMTKLGFDSAEKIASIDAEDRANARSREIATKDWTPRVIGLSVIAAAFTLEAVVLFHGVPMNLDGVVLGRIMGTLDSAVMLILAYYFGSSSGSADKSKTIANLANGK